MKRKSKYTKELLSPIVSKSRSIGQVLDSLGLKRTGGNYQNIKGHISRLEIDDSHFLGKGWNKGDVFGLAKRNTIPLEDILKENIHYPSGKLRPRLISAGLKENTCEICGLEGEWRGSPLTLHLDHINGNRNDNRLENLRILCPNCHSQTPTYCVKNKRT